MTADATVGGAPTGTSGGAVSDYRLLVPSETRALSLHAAYLRTDVDFLGNQAKELHGKTREFDLAERTRAKAGLSVATLLDELSIGRGMGWSDIAEVLGLSISAVRKWRKGGDASPESRLKLARIAAFLEMLEDKGIVSDPAAWMEMRLPLAAGFSIRPLDLYLEGHENALLDLAEQREDAEYILDQVRPNWREGRSEFEVVDDDDGERVIRRRGESES